MNLLRNAGLILLMGLPLNSPQARDDARAQLINRAYFVMAGEDRIISTQDKRLFLDTMGFKETALDEREIVSLVPERDGSDVTVYLTGGKYERYFNGGFGKAGVITPDKLRDYVKSKPK